MSNIGVLIIYIFETSVIMIPVQKNKDRVSFMLLEKQNNEFTVPCKTQTSFVIRQ